MIKIALARSMPLFASDISRKDRNGAFSHSTKMEVPKNTKRRSNIYKVFSEIVSKTPMLMLVKSTT